MRHFNDVTVMPILPVGCLEIKGTQIKLDSISECECGISDWDRVSPS